LITYNPSERLRKEIDEIINGELGEDDDLLGLMIEKSLRMVFQKILEQEVKDFLGRGYYERSKWSRRGYRNGYEEKRLRSAEGEIKLEVPQVRDTEQTYRSEFLMRIKTLSPRLKELVIEMYARGLSTRDIEEALKDENSSLNLTHFSG